MTFWNDPIVELLNIPLPAQAYKKLLNVEGFIFLEEKGIAEFQVGQFRGKFF